MNICMLVYNYHPNITGGAEKQCRLQAQELASRGHSCTILTARTKGELPRVESDGRCDIVRLTIVQPLIDGLLQLKRGFSRVGGRGALEAPR
ncbi:MAG: hypothetical protein D3910_14015, partial [Candidatus Electrothrix sp. ATG2]|nr:hypothetical protein [Candidatus Electrothrix sp. ATG2]